MRVARFFRFPSETWAGRPSVAAPPSHAWTRHIEAEWQNEISGPMQVSNVVAEIAGSELSHEWVLLGAHLDSWDLGTGAQDNGTGVVMVLEAARAIASLGRRRDDRFGSPSGPQRSPGHLARRCSSSGTQPSCAIAWLS